MCASCLYHISDMIERSEPVRGWFEALRKIVDPSPVCARSCSLQSEGDNNMRTCVRGVLSTANYHQSEHLQSGIMSRLVAARLRDCIRLLVVVGVCNRKARSLYFCGGLRTCQIENARKHGRRDAA
jgi:hypothetical protein